MNTVIHIVIDFHTDTYSSVFHSTSTSPQIFCANQTSSSKSNSGDQIVRKSRKDILVPPLPCGFGGLGANRIGLTGFGESRIPCVIMAPTTLPKAPGNHVKTDRIDAKNWPSHLLWGPTVPFIYRRQKIGGKKLYTLRNPGKRLSCDETEFCPFYCVMDDLSRRERTIGPLPTIDG
jgi:hypothetical protein